MLSTAQDRRTDVSRRDPESRWLIPMFRYLAPLLDLWPFRAGWPPSWQAESRRYFENPGNRRYIPGCALLRGSCQYENGFMSPRGWREARKRRSVSQSSKTRVRNAASVTTRVKTILKITISHPVSYTHLTLPTILLV